MSDQMNIFVDSHLKIGFTNFISPFKIWGTGVKTGPKKTYHTGVLIISLIILTVLANVGLCESRVKVHKELIHIQTSQQEGFIDATGQPGAIESTSPVIASIENISTHAKSNITIGKDGSFKTCIAATPEHKIRVWARNQEGKRSYGTFSIMIAVTRPSKSVDTPANPISEDTPPTSPLTSLKNTNVPENPPILTNPDQVSVVSPPALTPFEPNSPAPEKMNLAVIITVVNLETGQIVAAKRIAGIIQAKPSKPVSFKNVVTNIIDRCTNIVKLEITQPLFGGTKAINKSPTTSKSSSPAQKADTVKPQNQKNR
ncbi:MAG: hypothetical protein K9M57_10060 [Phycisphaerae bacterium]|nr:hypothetical protein [Phycisphaerae bacterium]